MYDVFCFLFYFLALLIYLRARCGTGSWASGGPRVFGVFGLFHQFEGDGCNLAGDRILSMSCCFIRRISEACAPSSVGVSTKAE